MQEIYMSRGGLLSLIMTEMEKIPAYGKVKSVIDIGATDIFHPVFYPYTENMLNQLKNSFRPNNITIPENLSEEYRCKKYQGLNFKLIWDILGIEYTAIDIAGAHDALTYDLNNDLAGFYGFDKTYDCVLSCNGTLEHVFNQYAVFKNIHNLCRAGGLISMVAAFDGNLDHGLYSIQPNLFSALANSNRYIIHKLALINFKGRNGIEFIDYLSDDFKEFTKKKIAFDEGLLLLFIAEKTKDEPFVTPIQESYVYAIDDSELRQKYIDLKNYSRLSVIPEGSEIAVFGTAVAGGIAFEIAKKLNFRVVCFADDYVSGTYKDTGIPVVSWDTMIKDYSERIFCVCHGPNQKGIVPERTGQIKFIELS